MALAVGPKKRVSSEPLLFNGFDGEPRSRQFVRFCEQYLLVQNGFGAGKPLDIREWQRELVASVLDADPQPRLAGWMLSRGNGKTSLAAALTTFLAFTSELGGSIVCCARSKDQAKILFGTARNFVETSPELLARCQVGRELMYLPFNRTSFEVLVSEPGLLEGLNYSFCVVDEFGVTPRESVNTLVGAQGKRPVSTLLGIGTPPYTDDPDASVLIEWRNLAKETGDQYVTWREFSADGFEHHPKTCEHCIRLASPAYGDFLARDVYERDAKTQKEPYYRRSRLCQFVFGGEDSFVDSETWDGLSTGQPIPDGAEVVLALDGSFGGKGADNTVLLLGTVADVPHFMPWRIWSPDGTPGYRVPVLEVEQAIRDACQRFRVKELVADPFRFNRSLQVLQEESMTTVMEFPHSPSRLTRATTDLHRAVTNARLSHSGDPTLRAHMLAATVVESDGGLKLAKANRSRTAARIDFAAATVMCYSRCSWLASRKPARRRVIGI